MPAPLVLIVDDEDLPRTHLADVARDVGFRVLQAASGVEALEVFSKRNPDIVVTDYHMPGMDGRNLVQRLRRSPKGAKTPIMVITSDDLRRTKILLLQAGADDFLVKPVEHLEFTARLSAMARRAALVDMLGTVTWERDKARHALEARTHELENLTLGLVAALERAASLNDTSTGNHIQRVASYAAHLAALKGCADQFVVKVLRYAGLHDVGKVGIPDGILKKPGRLSPEEFELMKTHTLLGGELLRAAGLSDVACNIAHHHHERWDGEGYPFGLKGENIPLEARVVAIADVFDALVTRRCYKPSFTLEEAWAVMEEAAGSQLDPHLVELFLASKDAVLGIFDRYRDEEQEDESWI